ncbi:putative f-box domain-containing protein [Rosellinia necatrix]|uniref:Putative f-box domain-containing protein n=1 Tax=Rosellinia necatrix TaxID=77044 RepID=A0A1W2TXN3_ROSNE|nr:putative f-box domain-containing protein [Rosellinia necatrix]
MDHPWRHPSGHISGATPSLHPDATRSTDEAHQTHFELAAVGSGSALYSNTGPIGHQEHPRNHTWDYYSVREQNTDRRCLPLSSSVATELAEPQVGLRKRKSPAVDNSMQNKKARVGEGTGGHSQFSGSQRLPAGVWRLIFTFLPPKMLGRLLSVSKGFNSFLCSSSKYSRDAPSSSTTDPLSIMRPEMIWQLSRRRFWPTMPTPFRDHTELEMWQLACQSGCHFHDRKCQRTPSPLYGSLNLEDKHSSGQLIWPFSLRSCVPCLVEMTTKEVDLMLSPSTPLCLLTALPFILIGDDMRIIPSTILQTVQAAMKLSVTKYFLSSHVEAIREEFTAIKAMGKATAEEWLKGLEGRGKVYRTDSQRWEKFEISGGLVRMQQRLSSDYTVDHGKMYASTKPSKDSVAASTVKSLSSGNPSPLQSATVASKSCLVYSQGENSSAQSILEHKIHPQANISRSKTREEAEDLKAVRRAEIERRAANLEPPLPAHILALIPTFQAAIQITLPLDDTAWNLLKPRLIAQRKDVDQQLKPKQETPPHFQTAFQQSLDLQSTRISTLKSKQHVDKTWDDVQVPLRERISILADRIIRDGWGGGRKVNRESSPRFAGDVLMYVRKQFYVEIQDSEDTKYI